MRRNTAACVAAHGTGHLALGEQLTVCGIEKMTSMMQLAFALRLLDKFAQVALPKTLTL